MSCVDFQSGISVTSLGHMITFAMWHLRKNRWRSPRGLSRISPPLTFPFME